MQRILSREEVTVMHGERWLYLSFCQLCWEYVQAPQDTKKSENGPALEAYSKLTEIGKLQAETQADIQEMQETLAMMGFPPMFTGVGLVPYDILANYFRGTLGIFDDLMECPDMVQKAVDLFTDLQIANLQYFRFVQMPVKRVMFWMHKGVDGFMSPKQFETLYWNPFLKVIHALVDMGVTPIIYTEGNYESRLEQMDFFYYGCRLWQFYGSGQKILYNAAHGQPPDFSAGG